MTTILHNYRNSEFSFSHILNHYLGYAFISLSANTDHNIHLVDQ